VLALATLQLQSDFADTQGGDESLAFEKIGFVIDDHKTDRRIHDV
jgi:hypothetical protein